ncbi:MAG TPA: SDR family NAD(P)-dependent oxidoreductase [Armatimonadaceae bacterium]|nr:SDR family NAD(P)-dependent oxidoreductase [Armatimonadaceae bacterium]
MGYEGGGRLLEGRVAFVTGGASGIGEAAARRFAEHGARVTLADVNDEVGERIRGEIEAAGGRAAYVHCDVSDAASVEAAFRAARGRWEGAPPDVLFANAGIGGVWTPIEDMRPGEWERTLRTNLEGAFLTLHYAIPHLREATGDGGRAGSVIITSSVSGSRTFAQPGASAYSTSKAGLVALMKMAALEWGRYNIRVNAVCPGAIPTNIQAGVEERHTDEIPIDVEMPAGNPALHGGVGSADDVADVCLFLASDLSRHVSGVELYVDGGASLIR